MGIEISANEGTPCRRFGLKRGVCGQSVDQTWECGDVAASDWLVGNVGRVIGWRGSEYDHPRVTWRCALRLVHRGPLC